MPDSQNYKKYDFKSVGQTQADINELRDTSLLAVPVGIKTPIQWGTEGDGIFAMHKRLADQIADNLRNLLLTNHGERLGLYNFGANLLELAFELGSDAVDAEAMRRISTAIRIYMPFVKLHEFIPFNANQESNTGIAHKGFSVIYNLPDLGVFNKRIDITLYAVG